MALAEAAAAGGGDGGTAQPDVEVIVRAVVAGGNVASHPGCVGRLPRQPKVQNLEVALVVARDVPGLQIAVNDPSRVQELEGLGGPAGGGGGGWSCGVRVRGCVRACGSTDGRRRVPDKCPGARGG